MRSHDRLNDGINPFGITQKIPLDRADFSIDKAINLVWLTATRIIGMALTIFLRNSPAKNRKNLSLLPSV
jgi:hypothetical protein